MKKLLLIILFGQIQCFAQNYQTYSGVMNGPKDIPSIDAEWTTQGKGIYRYYVNEEGARVMDGRFSFTYDYYGYYQVEILGQYKDGEKCGIWTFSQTTVGILSGKTINEADTKFTFSDDVLNGEFSVINYKSEVRSINGNFLHGKLDGKVVIKTTCYKGNGTVEGQFCDGYADGLWLFKRDFKNELPQIQTRLYYKGIPIFVKVADDSTGRTETLYQAPFPTDNLRIETIGDEDFLVIDGNRNKLKNYYYDSIPTGVICSPDFDGVSNFMDSDHLRVKNVLRSTL